MTSLQQRSGQEIGASPTSVPTYLKFLHILFAACIILAPLMLLLYAILKSDCPGCTLLWPESSRCQFSCQSHGKSGSPRARHHTVFSTTPRFSGYGLA